MSPWECALGLNGRLLVGPSHVLDEGHTPGWAAFMVYLGSWFSGLSTEGGTLYCITVVPNRRCCSALVAMGAILAAAQGKAPELSWDEFLAADEGAEVYYLQDRNGKTRPFLGKLISAPGVVPRKIEVLGQPNPTRYEVYPGGFERYHFKTTPYPTIHKLGRIAKLRPVLESLVSGFNNHWLISTSKTCLIITVVARWLRDLNGILVMPPRGKGRNSQPVCLKDALMVDTDPTKTGVKTHLCPPGGFLVPVERYPVVLADGPKALTSLRSVNARNVLVLINHYEFDDQVSDAIVSLTSRRDDSLVRNPGSFPAPLPPGVEMTVFAVPGPPR